MFVLKCMFLVMLYARMSVTQSRPNVSNIDTQRRLNEIHCHDWWFDNIDTCYMVYPEWVTRSDADRTCEQEGAHVVNIETDAENTFVESWLQEYWDAYDAYAIVYGTWLGGRRTNVTEAFTWSTGEVLNFTHWYTIGDSEPRPYDTTLPYNGTAPFLCMRTLNYGGGCQWASASCNDTTPYVCERPATAIRPAAAFFMLEENGPGCGVASITTVAECREAAASLGYSTHVKSGLDMGGYGLLGCYVGYPSNGWTDTYFNKQAGPWAEQGDWGFRYLCLAIGAGSTTGVSPSLILTAVGVAGAVLRLITAY